MSVQVEEEQELKDEFNLLVEIVNNNEKEKYDELASLQLDKDKKKFQNKIAELKPVFNVKDFENYKFINTVNENEFMIKF